jgi:hypothetical protein
MKIPPHKDNPQLLFDVRCDRHRQGEAQGRREDEAARKRRLRFPRIPRGTPAAFGRLRIQGGGPGGETPGFAERPERRRIILSPYSVFLSKATPAGMRRLLHARSAAVRACMAADLVEGRIRLQRQKPTQKVAALLCNISAASVARACRLSIDERQRVKEGTRPLVLPPVKPTPKPVPVPPVTMDAKARMLELVDALGVDQVLTLMAEADALKKGCTAA